MRRSRKRRHSSALSSDVWNVSYSYLITYARICWDHRVCNSEVRHIVLGNYGKSIGEVVDLHGLRWLGHILRMPNHRLPRRSMLTSVGDGWITVRDGQTKALHQSLKSLIPGLIHVDGCRLLGWSRWNIYNNENWSPTTLHSPTVTKQPV